MSLSTKYEQFLATPTVGALADDASLHYITTLTSVHDAGAILKHLAAQEKQVRKKGDKVLGLVHGHDALCFEMETTIEFVSGGGVYLPGLDENFLADRTATFPTIHIVTFDDAQKIKQIRLYWDQGSLLKQVEVIGARGKNWPIREGKDQARLVAAVADGATPAPSARRATNGNGDAGRSRPQSSKSSVSATPDPHRSLSLFSPVDPDEENTPSLQRPTIAPRQSAKPPPRGLEDILSGSDSPSVASEYRSPSPRKELNARFGASQKFQPIRLFEQEDADATKAKEKTNIKTDPRKYQHFDFGNGEDAAPTPQANKKPVNYQASWGFEDFATPAKAEKKVRGSDVRHFGWSDDEEPSPVKRPIVHRSRPDSEKHFELVDDGTPGPAGQAAMAAAGRSKGVAQNNGSGLYKDHVIGTEDGEMTPEAQKPRQNGLLSDVTSHINNESRGKTFDSQFEMTDHSPAVKSDGRLNGDGTAAKPAPAPSKKTHKAVETHWSLFEDSPARKENQPERKIYQTTGNGMGGRKGQGRTWGFGDDSDEEARKGEEEEAAAQAAKPAVQQKRAVDKSFWDF